MARITVGATAVIGPDGTVESAAGETGALYRTLAGATQITDVLDAAGDAIPGGIITATEDGLCPLVQPEVGAESHCFVSFGGGPRQVLHALDMNGGALDAAVAAALADDATVAAAAAAAVDDALDDAGVLVTKPIDGDLTFAVVDQANRRSWLEIDSAGAAPVRVRGLISEWVKSLPENLTPAGSGYAFAVVDPAGHISELALDDSGAVPQWILDRWAARLQLPPTAAPDLVVPSVIYTLTGVDAQLIHSHYIRWLSADHQVKVTNGTNGTKTLRDRWVAHPTAVATTPITVAVTDRVGATVATLTTSMVSNDATLTTPCRLLPIGDSITRTGLYASGAATLVGGSTVGTREISGVISEGRGGWTLGSHFSQIGTAGAAAVDSPFIFPVGVAAASYRGNTDFWKGVVGPTGTSDYGWAGFQRIARAGFATSGPFLFDASGYPAAPAENDVVVDPSLAAGSRWRKYVSGAWATMSPQPATEFSFSSYLTRYADAFSGGNPTAISIMLGTNDFYGSYSAAAFATFAANLDAFIVSIRAWSATVPIILCTAPSGGYQEDWATAGVHEFEYRDRMKAFTRAMITHYDTAAQRTNRVFLAPFLGCVDDADFGALNTVHPDAVGHTSMSTWLAGALASVLN